MVLGAGLFKQFGGALQPPGLFGQKEQLPGGGQRKRRWAPAECHAGSAVRSSACSVPAIHHVNNTEETRCFEQGDN